MQDCNSRQRRHNNRASSCGDYCKEEGVQLLKPPAVSTTFKPLGARDTNPTSSILSTTRSCASTSAVNVSRPILDLDCLAVGPTVRLIALSTAIPGAIVLLVGVGIGLFLFRTRTGRMNIFARKRCSDRRPSRSEDRVVDESQAIEMYSHGASKTGND